MKKTITVILLSIISIGVFCQDAIQDSEGDTPGQEFYKRYVYSDLSLTLGFTAGVHYEKLKILKSGNTRSFVIGAGYNLNFFYSPYINVLGNYCIRKGVNNIELGGGINILVFSTDAIVPLPDLHIGYKYQKPGKHLIFKSGVGFPKGIDVGVGYAF